MRFLIEATGGLTSGYLIKAIQEAGHEAVGSDIVEFNHSKILCDDFIVLPKTTDTKVWEITENLIKKHAIDVVLPSLDEMMLGWSEREEKLKKTGVRVIISPKKTIKTFQDKWETYLFFKKHNIPTPKTSLVSKYSLIKPRTGRGGAGIFEKTKENSINMEGMISQEKIIGKEYTVDVLFDRLGVPIYIIPRLRLEVKDGKSIKGKVVKHKKIEQLIEFISKQTKFIGPINFQLFETQDEKLFFIEINPRIGGGMALGFAATENWIRLIFDNIIQEKPIKPKPINFKLKMLRYYEEVFM